MGNSAFAGLEWQKRPPILNTLRRNFGLREAFVPTLRTGDAAQGSVGQGRSGLWTPLTSTLKQSNHVTVHIRIYTEQRNKKMQARKEQEYIT